MAKVKSPKAKKTTRRGATKQMTPMSNQNAAVTEVAPTEKGEAAAPKKWEGNATAFILQFPPNVKPKTIVEEAAKIGLTIKPSYASNIRSVAKKEGRLPASGPSVSTSKPQRAPSPSGQEDDETAFMRLLNRLGEARATRLLALYQAARSGK
jgi:hypothetical protein